MNKFTINFLSLVGADIIISIFNSDLTLCIFNPVQMVSGGILTVIIGMFYLFHFYDVPETEIRDKNGLILGVILVIVGFVLLAISYDRAIYIGNGNPSQCLQI